MVVVVGVVVGTGMGSPSLSSDAVAMAAAMAAGILLERLLVCFSVILGSLTITAGGEGTGAAGGGGGGGAGGGDGEGESSLTPPFLVVRSSDASRTFPVRLGISFSTTNSGLDGSGLSSFAGSSF